MPRPKNKADLLQLSNDNFEKLFQFIDALNADEQQAAFKQHTMNRNIRDVLAHLHHWHLMFLDWYKVGMAGDKPDMPAKGYTWKTTSDLNKWIWTQYLDTPLESIRQSLEGSFNELQQIIQNHTEEELFEKKRYKWTGSTSLGAYLISATSSHYDWALKLIKRARKK
jgi:hypothetical protein